MGTQVSAFGGTLTSRLAAAAPERVRSAWLILLLASLAACGGSKGSSQPSTPPATTNPPPQVQLPVVDPSITGPLAAQQTSNLALLAKVWGFLKYHHPAVTAGGIDWDSALILVLPAVLDAGDATASHDAVLTWLQDTLGEPASCANCAVAPTDVYFPADIAWIHDDTRLGAGLAAYLERVYSNRSTSSSQAYVSLGTGVNNAVFDSEAGYASMSLPDGGFRLLALFRLWNIVQYFFPYRDLLDEPWDDVLTGSIEDFYNADSRDAYARALLRTFGRIDDTHANLWDGRAAVLPPQGDCQLPVIVRFAEDAAVVAAYSESQLGPASGLEIGDAIVAIEGRSVDSLITEWSPYYPASNDAARLRDVARFLTRGPCGAVNLDVLRAGAPVALSTDRVSSSLLDLTLLLTHDLPGSTFQLLAPDVAYLKLSSVIQADSAIYVNDAAGTDGLIIDIRNYPNEFVVFSLGQHLVSTPTPFATFTIPDLRNPGAFVWGTVTPYLQPQPPSYSGKVAILIDETTQSQAEYTTMAFRTAPDAIVIGSTTAGADGNISRIPLPGGMRGAISGIGVFYPDRSPTQRIGIIPDIVVEPTIEGIAAGRDEVLEQAIAWIRQP